MGWGMLYVYVIQVMHVHQHLFVSVSVTVVARGRWCRQLCWESVTTARHGLSMECVSGRS